MPTNQLNFNQIATILQQAVSQATGQAVIAPLNTADFVTVASMGVANGYDPLYNALQQQISKTIFSIRPYNEKFTMLDMDATAWGNYTRKIALADQPMDNEDQMYSYPAGYDASKPAPDGLGQSVDHYKIKKPIPLELRFYGSHVYQDHFTVFRDQLRSALRGPEELGSFLSMQMEDQSNKWKHYRETVRRGVVANAIGAVIDEGQNERVVHLVSEYNTKTGLNLTPQSVYQPANFPAFMRWVSGRIRSIRRMMTERTQMYQTVINQKSLLRSSDYADQRMILLADPNYDIDANVLSITYHDENARIPGQYDIVSFWQSAETPDSVSVTPGYTSTAGVGKTGSAVEQAGVFGILFDRDCMGVSLVDNYTLTTPMNAAAAYYNTYNHALLKTAFDCSEKCVVFLLD